MSRTITVTPQPGASHTIGAAIEATDGPVTVLIEPGSYAEALLLLDRAVTLVAAQGKGTVTLVPAGPQPVLRAARGQVELRMLALDAPLAGAVECVGSRLTLTDCVIRADQARAVTLSAQAGLTMTGCAVETAAEAIVASDCSGTVADCDIHDVSGDGLVLMGADLVVRNTTISACGGRGIYMYQGARPTIESCEIGQIRAEGVVVAHGSAPVLRQCWVHDCRGPGLTFGDDCGGEVVDCRVEHTASPGILCAAGSDVRVLAKNDVAPVGVGAGAEPGPGDVASLLAELDALVGLVGVKAEVRALIAEIQVNGWRRGAGLSATTGGNHLIFTGAPGTGKTTVARIYGQLLKRLGVLPKGNFTEVSRRDLVGQYVGHTAEKTAAAFESAMGGVLFVDEAYTLSRGAGGPNDFGQESIDTLVKLMEDHRSAVAVIAAGYTDEMEQFLLTNPGLASRFSKTIEFENYTTEQLVQILLSMIDANDYVADPAVPAALAAHFDGLQRGEKFGNARESRKLFETMRKRQAQRLLLLGRMPSTDELRELVVADIGT